VGFTLAIVDSQNRVSVRLTEGEEYLFFVKTIETADRVKNVVSSTV